MPRRAHAAWEEVQSSVPRPGVLRGGSHNGGATHRTSLSIMASARLSPGHHHFRLDTEGVSCSHQLPPPRSPL